MLDKLGQGIFSSVSQLAFIMPDFSLLHSLALKSLAFEAPFLETSMVEMGGSTDHFDTQKRADDCTGDDNYWNSSAFEEQTP